MSTPIILDMNTSSIQYLCQKDKKLAKVISMVGSISYTPYDDPYAFLIHEIIEQMLSIKAGQKIYERLELLCNGSICPSTISSLSASEIKSIGISQLKVKSILDLTRKVLNKDLIFEDLQALSDESVVEKLTSIQGIGQWTSKMYLIFVLDRQNILPYEDGAFLQSFRWLYNTKDVSKESVFKKCKKWNPYASIASRYMYKVLDLGFTKVAFNKYS